MGNEEKKDQMRGEHIRVNGLQNTVLTGTVVYNIIKPLQILWEPKEDITVYELALCMPLLLSTQFNIMPGDIDIEKPFMRHFNIVDPNK